MKNNGINRYILVVILLVLTSFSLNAYSMSTKKNVTKSKLFEERIIYFDRAIDVDENYALLKEVIVKASKLGFNILVLNEEFIYARLSHKNSIIDKMKKRFSEIERLADAQGLKIIAMHFNAEVPTFVVKDGDPENPFYQRGKFDFSESNRAKTRYKVVGDIALVEGTKERLTSRSLFDGLYHYKDIKPNTEYRLVLNASAYGYTKKVLKVSVLDEDHKNENGKLLYGVQKYFRNIKVNSENENYSVYFNSLNHKNLNGAIKVYLSKQKNIVVNSLTLEEVGYTKGVHVVREDTKPVLRGQNKVYVEGKDYHLNDENILLLSADIKEEKSLELLWYPRIDVSRFYDHETTADICADEKLYHDIMLDQYTRMKKALNANLHGIAFNNDEWREAGWNKKCEEIYAKEYKAQNRIGGFTGGDYIGISTKRMIENLLKGEKPSMKAYVMSDMFDPNFNAKDPYMGVNNGAEGAIDYLPKETVVFNWFPNPYEPGLEDKTMKDFLKSAKHFADYGISQIIAGYHDDMRNLDSNIAFYRDSDAKTQESIIGYMFLIWHQPSKKPSYDDMEKVVKRLCTGLPSKWPEEVCKTLR